MHIIKKAKRFAEVAHHDQKRKNSNVAYITHPIRVAAILQNAGFSEELICAGYLHDVVEDTPYTIAEIETEFGPKVARLVQAHTEDKTKLWRERKQHTINTVKNSEKEVKYLIVADKLDNLLDLETSYQELGDQIWENFHAGPQLQKWYNESIVENMTAGLTEDDIPDYFQTYEKAVTRVFSLIK